MTILHDPMNDLSGARSLQPDARNNGSDWRLELPRGARSERGGGAMSLDEPVEAGNLSAGPIGFAATSRQGRRLSRVTRLYHLAEADWTCFGKVESSFI
jgi:hypothetical protein